MFSRVDDRVLMVLVETGQLLGTVMVPIETEQLLMPEGVNCRLQDEKVKCLVSGQILLLRF